MNRLHLTVAVVALLIGANGCQHAQLSRHGCGDSHCSHCVGSGGGGLLGARKSGGHLGGKVAGKLGLGQLANGTGPDRVAPLPQGYQNQMGPAGPAGPQVAYPYYTVRGPRDFFLNEPNPIGR